MIESKDFHQYAVHLRAAGCPEFLVGDLIVAEVERSYQRSAQSTTAYLPPWENADRRRLRANAEMAKQAALGSEKQGIIKAALGYEWDDRNEQRWNQNPATSLVLGFLPDEKAAKVTALDAHYTQSAEAIRLESGGILIEDDRTRLQMLYDSWMTDKSQLLDPNESDELQLRIQAEGYFPAYNIHLDGVDVSDAQLRELARASTEVKDMAKDRFVEERNVAPEEWARRQVAFESQVRNILGADGYADYQRAQDDHFRETYDFTQKSNLSKADAIDIFDAQLKAEEQLKELNADTSMTPDEHAAAQAVLKTVTANAISSRLGSVYRDYLAGPGRWLENLAVATPIENQTGMQ